MLLGAWIDKKAERILDIGTGTGILALMLAQKNPEAQITAIEPDLPSLNEARENFIDSEFRHQIMPVHARLQDFGAMEKFGLIVANPPYFENAFLSENADRNRARHTHDLPIQELYISVSDLLTETGTLAVIIPFDLEDEHLQRAEVENLYPRKILRTRDTRGGFKRSLIQFGFDYKPLQVSEISVKNAQNKYSAEYIEMTKDFYNKDLSQQGH